MLGAAENDIAKRFVPVAREKGAVTVDNSSAYRLDPDVPLMIPEVNPEDVAKHNGIIANPNCATIIGLVAVNPLHKLGGIKRMVVSYVPGRIGRRCRRASRTRSADGPHFSGREGRGP